jgi:tetratricopeptide (TPR) repeat protein
MMIFFDKRIVLVIALLICNGCTAQTVTTSNSPSLSPSPSPSPSPSLSEVATPDCLKSLPSVSVRKDKSSKEVETEGDKFEAQGKGQEAIDKYSEAYLLYQGELGYATGRAMRGDPSASMEVNTSMASPEFPFKIGRTAAKVGNHKMAITCFTESLDRKIASPNDANAYLNRGDAHERMGAKEKARKDFQQAVNLFKKYKLPSYQKLAESRLKTVIK